MMERAFRALNEFYRDRLGLVGTIALHEPSFKGRERDYVMDCLDTGWVSSVGAYVDRFESDMAARVGCRFGIATVNGTAALHLILHAIGVGPGDLVICPPLSFVATTNAIAYCGATPVFVDINPASLGLDPHALATFLDGECTRRDGRLIHRDSGRRIAAVLPVHIFGHPCDMMALAGVAAAYNLPIIEDSTEALGSSERGRPCGSLGLAGVFSFNGNKIITTGGGGMITTDDETLAKRLKHLSTTARAGGGWTFDHDEIGFNYRLPNLNAALGCAQLEGLDERIARKRRLHEMYGKLLADIDGIHLFIECGWAHANYWLNALLLDDPAQLEPFLSATNGAGIQTRPCWRLLCDLPAFVEAPRHGLLARARDIAARLVNLPSSPELAA